jgi:hypothetical protein
MSSGSYDPLGGSMRGKEKSPGRGRNVGLWILAFVLMLSAGVYQRYTGPTYKLRGSYSVGESVVKYRLVRSAYSTGDTVVSIPAAADVTGDLVYRRYPTDDEFTRVPMQRRGDELVGTLPAQPPAGKLEYHLELATVTGPVVAPDTGENAVIRFKGWVPAWVLILHVAFMFFGVLVAWRVGLGALFSGQGIRKLSWAALILFTVGGFFLGPWVQKYAFDDWWTGVPFGWDLTDNKTLVMWLAWFFALLVTYRGARRDADGGSAGEKKARLAVVIAAVVTVAVYLIPHSMAGSQLDYDAVDRGVAPEDAIGVG